MAGRPGQLCLLDYFAVLPAYRAAGRQPAANLTPKPPQKYPFEGNVKFKAMVSALNLHFFFFCPSPHSKTLHRFSFGMVADGGVTLYNDSVPRGKK